MLDGISFEEFVDNCRHSLQNYYQCHFDQDCFIDNIWDESDGFGEWWKGHIARSYHYSMYSYNPDYFAMAEIMFESSTDWECEYCNHCNEYIFTHGECENRCDPDLNWETPDREEQISYLAEFIEDLETIPDDECIEKYLKTYIWEQRLSTIEAIVPNGLRQDIESLLESEPSSVCYDSIMWVHHVMSLYHASGNILDDYGSICITIVDDIRDNGLEKYFADDLEELLAEAI